MIPKTLVPQTLIPQTLLEQALWAAGFEPKPEAEQPPWVRELAQRHPECSLQMLKRARKDSDYRKIVLMEAWFFWRTARIRDRMQARKRRQETFRKELEDLGLRPYL